MDNGKLPTFALVAQWIEHQLAELRVVGSSPIERTMFLFGVVRV